MNNKKTIITTIIVSSLIFVLFCSLVMNDSSIGEDDNIHSFDEGGIRATYKVENDVITLTYVDAITDGKLDLSLIKHEGKGLTNVGDQNGTTLLSNSVKSSLTKVVVNEELTYIGKQAFMSCSKLSNVSFEEGSKLKTIGDKAFYSCSKLASIALPNSLESIGTQSFYLCKEMTSVTIHVTGSNLKTIGEKAFYSCSKLASIALPNSLESIGTESFSTCSVLNSVTIDVTASKLKTIGDKAFYKCSKLSSITLPNSLESIGTQSFSTDSGSSCLIESIKIPGNVKSVGDSAFKNCKVLKSIQFEGKNTSVGKNAFQFCTALETIRLPNGLKSISDYMFSGCNALTTIEIPSTVTSIGTYAFSSCTKLNSLTLPNNLTSIGSSIFSGCTALASINVPSNVSSIGTYAFSNCTSLTSVTLPSGLTKIESNMFEGCKALTTVKVQGDTETYTGAKIPTGVTSIGASAFKDCTSLTSIALPSDLTSIGNNIFNGCTALASIDVPNSVSSIGTYAFSNCTSLTSVTLPSDLTEIKSNMFEGCKALTTVKVQGDTETYTGAKIPTGVTSIGASAFKGCTNLTSIDVPDGVICFNNDVFNGCSKLTSIGFKDNDWARITGYGTDWNLGVPDHCLVPVFPENISLSLLGSGVIPEGKVFKSITILDDNGKFTRDCFKGVSTETLTIQKITTASSNVFYNINAGNVIIGKNVTSIPAAYFCLNTTFVGNDKITEVTIQSTKVEIGSNAFRNCSNLTKFDFTKVTKIDSNAFNGCINLYVGKVIDLTSLANRTISVSAFDNTSCILNVSSIDTFMMPTTKAPKTRLLIKGTPYGTEIKVDDSSSLYTEPDSYGGNSVLKFTGTATTLTIKDDWNITSIAGVASSMTIFGNSNLTTIDLGSKIKYIGAWSFQGSRTIESVTWSSNSVRINEGAFMDCSGLTTIGNSNNSIESVISISNNAFRNCTSLKYVSYSEKLVISDYAFMGCSSLRFNEEGTLRITANVGQYAFSGTGLEKVIICTQIPQVSSDLFKDCTSLKEVVIEDKSYTLTNRMFMNCPKLDTIKYKIEDGYVSNVIYANSIGNNTFLNTGFTDLTIGSGSDDKITIGKYAFASCSNLTGVKFNAHVIMNTYAFNDCENLRTVTFTKDVSASQGSEIGTCAFANCVSLTSSSGKDTLQLYGVTSIGKMAFDGCISITNVTLSKYLEDIKVDSFSGCTSLRTSDDTYNGLIIENGGLLKVDGNCILDGKKIVMINPNVESIVIGKQINEIAGVKDTGNAEDAEDTAISVLTKLKRIVVEDGNDTFKSVSGMLVTKADVLLAVPCDLPSEGYLEISGIKTIGQFAFRSVNVTDLVINGATEVKRLAFCGCSSLERLTIDSGEQDLIFTMESVYSIPMESITLKGKDIAFNSLQSFVKNLTILSKNVTFDHYEIDNKETPMLESLTVYAEKKIVWYGSLLNQSGSLRTLTLASKEIELKDSIIINYIGKGLRANISVDDQQYEENLIAGDVDVYVSDAMSDKWNGYYEGLIYYDSQYGVLTAFSGSKVYILSDFARIEAIDQNGKFTVTSDEHHSAGDILVQMIGDNNQLTEMSYENGGYSISDYSVQKIYLIKISEVEDGSDKSKWYTVSFVSKDPQVEIPSVYVYEGHSILQSVLPTPECPGYTFQGWYIDEACNNKYKGQDGGQITQNTKLYAKWTSLGNYLDVDSVAGIFYIINDDGSIGQVYTGGARTSQSTIKLKFIPYTGYTLIGMSLTNLKEDVVKEDLTIEVSDVKGYACITPIVKYFSSSTDLEYVVERDTPRPTDSIVLAWRFSGEVKQTGMSWSGMPSVPLIVDDYVYIQVNERIVCLDARTGATIKEVDTGSSTTQFYHYLGYGGGYIVDYTSMKVFTCDLEEVCGLPTGIQYVVWYGDHFYGIIKNENGSRGAIWKMSPTETDNSGVMINLWNGTTKDVNAFQYLFGTTSHAIVEQGVMYYISTDSENITINALDLNDGTYASCQLVDLYGYYLDDGWLTYYDGYLYISAYTKGLFGSYTVTGNSVIGYMKVDGTNIDEPKYVTIKDKSGKEEDRDSLTSAFVIQNGRGYLNITKSSQSSIGYFQVFDIGEDGKPVFVKEVDSVASHGSIVASTYNLTKNDDGKLNGEVYIYLLNYSAGQTLTVFTDVCKDGEWTLSDRAVKFSIESGFGSQAVRVGTEGQLIFYNDSGFVYCYGTPEFAKKSWFFVDNGDTAEITTGDGVDKDSIKAFEKAVANMLGVRKATFDKTNGTVYALGTTYYVYYYGDDGVAHSVKFTDTFDLNKFSKIKTFYLNKDVSDASDLNPDAEWNFIDGDKKHVKTSVKDIMQNLRSYGPMTIGLLPYVSYGYDDEHYTLYGDSGDVVNLTLKKIPSKSGYTFVGFTDGETIYRYTVNDEEITSPNYTLKGYVTLEPVWFEDGKSFNSVEVKIGDDLVVEDMDSIKLLVGDNKRITVSMDGSGVSTISSSNSNVLKIEDGKLAALKAGKAVLTITISSPIKEQVITVEVNVVEPTSNKVEINKSSISLYKGASTTLSASTDLKGVGVIWTSSDPRIAMVDSNGKVTAISEGVALITATAADDSDVKAVCTVTVSLKKVTSISLSQTSKTMKVGDSSTLSATIAPSDAEDKRVTWSSSNPSVVSVTASGAIQALSKGTAIVTATTVDGSFSASCTVKVEGTVSSISLDKTMLRLEVGSNSTLKATTYPDEALSSNISWTSSDASIVSVSGGYVYAYKVGTATITVSYGDLTATCTVIVSEKSVVKEDTKENTDGSKTVTKEEKTVSGDSTITTNTEETKDKDDKSMGSDVKISAESENKAVKTEATVKKDADGKVIESNVKTTVEAKIQTKDGKEIVTVSKEDILSAVDQIGAVKNTAGGNVEPVIVIDIGKASTASSSSIDLSYESLVQIADGNDTTLRVNTSAGTLEMSSDVISTLSSDGSDLKLGIEKVSDDDVTKVVKEKVKDSTVFSLTATLGKTNVHQLGGKVSVSLPYALKGTVSSDVRIYHVDDDGTLKEMSCKYDANSGMVSFVTDHFSYFVVSEESLVSDAADSDNGISEMNTLLKIVIGLLAVLIAMAAIAMFVHFRGN